MSIMHGFSCRFLLHLFLSLASGMALAQEPTFAPGRPDSFRMPTGEEMAKAQAKAREAINRLPDLGSIKQQYGATGMPKIEAGPRSRL